MATFNGTNPVTVGSATKKDHYDRAFDNAVALKEGDAVRDKETLDGIPTAAEPAVSPAGDARLYYNSDDDEIKLSKNAGAYAKLAKSVLQVQQASTVAEDSSTSGTYADTSLTLSFTPQRDDSTILIFVTQAALDSADAADRLDLRLMRDGTELQEFATSMKPGTVNDPTCLSYMHKETSPGTSAVTYHTEFNRAAGSGTVYCQRNSAARSSIVVVEVES